MINNFFNSNNKIKKDKILPKSPPNVNANNIHPKEWHQKEKQAEVT